MGEKREKTGKVEGRRGRIGKDKEKSKNREKKLGSTINHK